MDDFNADKKILFYIVLFFISIIMINYGNNNNSSVEFLGILLFGFSMYSLGYINGIIDNQ